jgi:phosphopantothenoylcysteine synthetase/decarboxylase
VADAVPRLYHVVCGTTTAYRAPEIIAAIRSRTEDLIVMLSPGATRVISPRMLMLEPGHRLVESYFDEAILPRPADGPVVVAPCSFNTLNKLAQGIADSLPHSLIADIIGRGLPVIVAISANLALMAHPRAAQSIATLRSWGVSVIDPVELNGELTMAPTEAILQALDARISDGTPA